MSSESANEISSSSFFALAAPGSAAIAIARLFPLSGVAHKERGEGLSKGLFFWVSSLLFLSFFLSFWGPDEMKPQFFLFLKKKKEEKEKI